MPFSAVFSPLRLVSVFSSLPRVGEPVSICFCEEFHYLPSLPDTLHEAIVILLLLHHTWDTAASLVLALRGAVSTFGDNMPITTSANTPHQRVSHQLMLQPASLKKKYHTQMQREPKGGVSVSVIAPAMVFPGYISRQLHFKGKPWKWKTTALEQTTVMLLHMFPCLSHYSYYIKQRDKRNKRGQYGQDFGSLHDLVLQQIHDLSATPEPDTASQEGKRAL